MRFSEGIKDIKCRVGKNKCWKVVFGKLLDEEGYIFYLREGGVVEDGWVLWLLRFGKERWVGRYVSLLVFYILIWFIYLFYFVGVSDKKDSWEVKWGDVKREDVIW